MRAVFLDRDGIINKSIIIRNKPFSPKCVQEVKIIDGIDDLLRFLATNNYLIIVITNQPEISRGNITEKNVFAINDYLEWLLPINEIYTCPHQDSDNCVCRKPKIGSYLDAIRKYKIDVSQSFNIGDRWRDIEAGRSAGLKNIFVNYGYSEKQPENSDYIVKSVKDIIPIFEKELNVNYISVR
jgi:D-glycero-D-manno-heptose 1,7-bisphosphate phosphatase